MTITLEPTTQPIDFDQLPPFEGEFAEPTRDNTKSRHVRDIRDIRHVRHVSHVRDVRRPGVVGAVAVRPILAEATAASETPPIGRRRRWDWREVVQGGQRWSPQTPMDPAIARRRVEVAETRPRIAASMVAWGIGLALVLIAVAMLFSPWMSVRSVEVVGGNPAIAAQVRSIADRRIGTAMIRFPVDEIRRTIKNQPDIATVEVAKHWPEQVQIRITVREPFAVVSIDGADRQLIDRSGVVLPTRATPPLPLIAVNADATRNSNATPTGSAEKLESRRTSALAILAALDEGTRRAVDRVDNFGDEFVLRMGKASVLVGRPDDLTAKAMLVGSLHRSERLPKSGTIDVTIPDAVILGE